MLNKNINFILVPDSNARRRVLTTLVQSGNSVGVMVGTWTELLVQVTNDYQIVMPDNDWADDLRSVIAGMSGAFWAKSFLVEPDETSKIIESHIKELLAATLFSKVQKTSDSKPSNLRVSKILADLEQVIGQLGDNIPSDLFIVGNVISKVDNPSRRIRIYHEESYPKLSIWQSNFIDVMNSNIDSEEIDHFRKILIQESTRNSAIESTSLGHIQRNLYKTGRSVELDHSIQYLGVRDYLEEIEVVAGIIQNKINNDPSLTFSDFGILIPQADNYVHALNSISSMAGIPMSGLPHVTYLRDVARETILNFLECQNKPAPAMAIAELLTSSMMPWSEQAGIDLAQQLMDGRYELSLPTSSSDIDKQALSLIFEIYDSPAQLVSALEKLKEVILASAASLYQIDRANESIDLLIQSISNSEQLKLGELSALIKPAQIKEEYTGDFYKEGVSIFIETQELWRGCKHLLILGFNSKHYPSQAGFSPVFSDDDVEHLKDNGIQLQSRKNTNLLYLNRFLRQLSTCSDSCTFLIPRLKADSSRLYPSESLVYMHSLLKGFDEPEAMILDLDLKGDLLKTHSVFIRNDLPKQYSWKPKCEDLDLNIDLLTVSNRGREGLRPLSPSRMEDLMVSPLAWLLSWLDLEPKGWKPDEPNVLILGSLAHGVFEDLFQPKKVLPTQEYISEQVEGLLNLQLQKIAPFMLLPKWDIERHKLVDDITISAKTWLTILIGLDARIVDNEIWLKGEYAGVPIHGQADSILQLSNGQLIIVDHKKAGVSNRKPRMEKGYDCQVSLYREMLKMGLPKPHDDLNKDNVEVLYYLMNGQRAISEKGTSSNKSIPGWITVDNDVSINAMELIKKRIAQIRKGSIHLNKDTDEQFYNKTAGFKPYALDKSPLISLFMIEDTSEVQE